MRSAVFPNHFVLCVLAYIQTSRALMISACLLGLPALLLVIMSMPCVRLQNDTSTNKLNRSRIGGALYIVMGKQNFGYRVGFALVRPDGVNIYLC